MAMIDVTQEDRQYWKVWVPMTRPGSGERGNVGIEITISPEGIVAEMVEDGEFAGTARWETWDELAEALES